MHVATPDGECKFWMEPITLARNRRVSPHVVRQIERLVFENQILLRDTYNEYHNR
ncbi:MAG TPA: DUF4160 domain-containing protein [Blastocatellia bacterium]|nr:DUF4160 domain-containing protein [Blastocatellia bacterium]